MTSTSHSLRLRKLAFRLHYFFLRGKSEMRVAEGASEALQALTAPAPGDARRGEELLLHHFTFYGERHDLSEAGDLRPADAGPYWLTEFHGFAWILDLLAFNHTYIAATHLRDYIYRWSEQGGRLPAVARHPIVMGERVANWVRYSHLILNGASLLFTRHFIRSLAEQAFALHESIEEKGGASSFAAIKGVLLASLLLPDALFMRRTALAALEAAMAAQILPDGGHVSRSPSLHVRQFEHLLQIRQLAKQLDFEMPAAFDQTLARAAGMLRFLMHDKAGLALFNDSIEERPEWLAALLNHVALATEPARAEQSGFERLQAGQTRVIMDVGLPNPASSHSFSGTASFELSDHSERIVVNCGAYRGAKNAWRKVCKTTAAHSALSLGERNAFQLPHTAEPSIGVRYTQGAVEVTHNGYEDAYKVKHTRRLVLQEEGRKLSGLDRLLPSDGGSVGDSMHIRFHLHPHAKPRRSANSGWEIVLPSGAVWEFTCSAGEDVLVEESVYLGREGRPQKTQQLVITQPWTANQDVLSIGWTFEKKRPLSKDGPEL